jgi:VIT1/CCC1 family predicted Fe2+/Mn2+ transporter
MVWGISFNYFNSFLEFLKFRHINFIAVVYYKTNEKRRDVSMKHSYKVGLCFGLTSGIITTLGLMIGLNSGTNSNVLAIVGGILTIAIADSFSDALGIHISEESENKHTSREIWESTLSTFLCKFIIASSFIIPVLLFEITNAIIISIIWGLLLLSIVSYNIAKEQKKKPWFVVGEHLVIAAIVIVAAHYVGHYISIWLG